MGWRDALRDGGAGFAAWDALRRSKQHVADLVRRLVPPLRDFTPVQLGRVGTLLMRGRPRNSRGGTLPLDVLKRVVTEAGPGIERLDLFNYGEPFLYRHLVEALRHVRAVMPRTTIAISTDGMQVRPEVEETIAAEGLLDSVVFSVDGADDASYRRYRIRGRFDQAFSNLVRFHRRAAGTGIQVIWQYVVFRWNDRDDQFRRAIGMAKDAGITIWFDFAHSWGRSHRRPEGLGYLAPYLRPYTALPGEPRQQGW